MSFTAPLRPSPSLRSLFRGGIPSGANSRSAYSHTSTPQSLRARLGSNSTTASSSSSSALAIPFPSARSHSSSNTQGARSIFYAVGLGGAFVLASLTPWRKSASCQAANGSVFQSSTGPGLGNGPGTNDYPEPPKSILSLYELGFGTVAGICSGVFLKKGLRAIAFLLGGAFIFLQVSRVELGGDDTGMEMETALKWRWDVRQSKQALLPIVECCPIIYPAKSTFRPIIPQLGAPFLGRDADTNGTVPIIKVIR